MRLVLALILALRILAAPTPFSHLNPRYEENTQETHPTVNSELQDTFDANHHSGQEVAGGGATSIPHPGTEDLDLDNDNTREERGLDFRAVRGAKMTSPHSGGSRYWLSSSSTDKRDGQEADEEPGELDERAVRGGAALSRPQSPSRYSLGSHDKRDESDVNERDVDKRAARGGAALTRPQSPSRYWLGSHDKREALDESDMDERAVRGGAALTRPQSPSRYSFSSHDKRDTLQPDDRDVDERAVRGGAAMIRPQSPSRYSFSSHDKREALEPNEPDVDERAVRGGFKAPHSGSQYRPYLSSHATDKRDDDSPDAAPEPEERAVRGGSRLSSPYSGSRYHFGSTDKRDEGELEKRSEQDARSDSRLAAVEALRGSRPNKRGLLSSPLGVEIGETHDRRPVV